MLDVSQLRNIHKNYESKPESCFAVNYCDKANNFAIQPRGGVGRLTCQHDLMRALEASGADFLPITVDSYTRLGDLARASAMLEAENIYDKNILNGFPICSHKIDDVRWMINQFNRPTCLRHGTAYPENVFNAALSAGITEFEGGAISYVLPYSRRADLVKAIDQWTSVELAVGKLNLMEIPFSRESFGPLSATLVPPIMVIITQLAELTLAIVCGVKYYTVTLPEFHNHTQIILCKLIIESCQNTLKELTKNDFSLSFGIHQWMSVFPADIAKANALIATSASFAANARFDKLITKSAVEALRIPTTNDNCSAIEMINYIRKNTKFGGIKSWEIDSDEYYLIKNNVENILNNFWNIAAGISHNKFTINDLKDELLNLILIGQIDIPFAPHEKNRNKVVTCLDCDGNVRILMSGDLNLSDDYANFEESKARAGIGNQSISEKIQKDIFVKC